MIFSVIILLAVLGIAFFHYVQGFFSATVSAMLAVLSAVLAFGLHETVVEGLLGGKMAGVAHAMVLMILFAAIYLSLRIAFDMLVAGNVRVPVIVDKVGAAIMGLVAGIFATGVVAVAAQELSFGPSVAGYSRYAIQGDKGVAIPRAGQGKDSAIWDELKSDAPGTFDPGDVSHLFPPVDDILIGTVRILSDGGSLAGTRSLASVHPDFIQELFGQRIGVQVGANRVAANLPPPAGDQVSVGGVYVLLPGAFTPLDTMPNGFRKVDMSVVKNVGPNDLLLVVRLGLSKSGADADNIFRLSPASSRLVVPRKLENGVVQSADYYPVGTLENGQLFVNKLDDYLFVDVSAAQGTIDLVYKVDKSTMVKAGQTLPAAMPAGSFVEIKRLARVGLGGMAVSPAPLPQPVTFGIMHPPVMGLAK